MQGTGYTGDREAKSNETEGNPEISQGTKRLSALSWMQGVWGVYWAGRRDAVAMKDAIRDTESGALT